MRGEGACLALTGGGCSQVTFGQKLEDLQDRNHQVVDAHKSYLAARNGRQLVERRTIYCRERSARAISFFAFRFVTGLPDLARQDAAERRFL